MLFKIFAIILAIVWILGIYAKIRHKSLDIFSYLVPTTLIIFFVFPVILVIDNISPKTYYFTEIKNEITNSLMGYRRYDYNPYLLPEYLATTAQFYWRGTEEFEYISQNKSKFTFK